MTVLGALVVRIMGRPVRAVVWLVGDVGHDVESVVGGGGGVDAHLPWSLLSATVVVFATFTPGV